MVASPKLPTSYQLVIEVRSPVCCPVGRLGVVDFPVGNYVYTGSARRNFEARLARHARADKTLRWHIDYLLAARDVHIVRIVRSRRDECPLNQSGRGEVRVPGFGASDCKAGCGAHLKYVGPYARDRSPASRRGGGGDHSVAREFDGAQPAPCAVD